MPFVLMCLVMLSFTGLGLCAVLHVMSLTGAVWAGSAALVSTLGFVLFPMWLTLILISRQRTKFVIRSEWHTALLAGCPPWVKPALIGLMAYAVLNVMLLKYGPQAASAAGGFDAALRLRAASGHLMLFYAAASAIFFSAWRTPPGWRSR